MTQMNAEARDGQHFWTHGWGATLVLCGLIFLALTIAVSSFGVGPAERGLSDWIIEWTKPSLEGIFPWVDELGDEAVLLSAAFLMALALPSRQGQRWWLLIAVLILSSGVEELVKKVVGRSGPGGVGVDFPSGEVSAAAGYFVICAYLVQRAVVTEIGKVAVWALAGTCVTLVSISRIVVHAQWPLDTIGGAMLGATCAAAVVWLVKTYQISRQRGLFAEIRASPDCISSGTQEAPETAAGWNEGSPVPLLLQALYYLYQRRLMAQIRVGPMPRHIGIILDGNRRYGAERGLTEAREIYRLGARKLDDILGWCSNLRIPAITLWVLSTDNLTRPADQVSGILGAVESKLNALASDPRIHRRRVRVRAVGRIDILPESTQRAIEATELATTGYDAMVLTIAVAYGGREEVADAVKAMLRDKSKVGMELTEVIDEVTPTLIGRYLYTVDLPDPDLIIRTSGEIRLSGFLMWQSAYSEYYFTDVYWPAFRKIDLLRAIRDFQRRKRRFGR
jgi:short-chain Z-isoprenyl diphosphate synthase